MVCPHCGSSSGASNGRCVACGTVVADGPTVAAGVLTPPPDAATKAPDGSTQSGAPEPAGALRSGQDFGTRYHIIRLLGVGGMGAVYQAWDQVLEVAVALKVIHADPSLGPAGTEVLTRRFKRELLLARQVTHRNVVRIHDLGEIDGITYITMPYVHGENLAAILARDGRLPVERVLSIGQQVAAGLVAAHDAGVVHRDLKPANIMVDAEDNALIMDFGIARSTTGMPGVAAVTRTGVVVGTVEYMAPEQARGQQVDQRADVYSFGLILNDLLLGRRQGAASGVGELVSRMAQAPASVRSIDPTIPAGVDALVTKCLQPDPAARFQNMREVHAALDALGRDGQSTSRRVFDRPVARWIAAAVVLLVAVGSAGVWRARVRSRAATPATAVHRMISVAVLPFKNASADVTLDSLGAGVSEVLRTELGQSARLRTVPADRLDQVLRDLRLSPTGTIAASELARAAELANAGTVISGQITRFGDAIRIDATLQDLENRQTVPLNVMAPSESQLLPAIAKLAEAVRETVARGAADVLTELKTTSWKPSTTSFDALRLYSEGRQLAAQGDHQTARKQFEAATKADANFALAFSGLARAYANLGYDAEAAQASKRAMALSDALPPQEKYVIAATHYQIVNDVAHAIEANENLVKASPTNAAVQFDLGALYERTGDFNRAQEHFSQVVALDPKYIEGLLALGRVDIKRGAAQESLEYLNRALTLAIELDRDETRANVLQATGIAYKILNRPEEALRRYEESLEIKRRLGNKRGMAASFGEIAQVQAALGRLKEAEKSYHDALDLQREIGDQSGIATSLTNLAVMLNESSGRPDAALPLLREALQIRRATSDKSGEALVLNNMGSVYLAKAQYADAQTYFERALELREKLNVPQQLADTIHNLAESLSKMGRYDDALAQYVRALDMRRQVGDRRSAAMESYSIGMIFDYQARYGAAVKSKESALATFRELKRRDMWLPEILGGYGASLSASGRTQEAEQPLDEAMRVARELNNPTLIAQAARFQADRLYLRGELDAAKRAAADAVQTAGSASDRGLALAAQAEAAIIDAAVSPTKANAARLASLAEQADTLGLPYLAVDCAIRRAYAAGKSGDAAVARREIDRALARAEALGFRLLTAQAHYVRGELLRASGDAGAAAEYTAALRILEEIRAEDGNHDVLKRADFAAMHADCVRWSKGA